MKENICKKYWFSCFSEIKDLVEGIEEGVCNNIDMCDEETISDLKSSCYYLKDQYEQGYRWAVHTRALEHDGLFEHDGSCFTDGEAIEFFMGMETDVLEKIAGSSALTERVEFRLTTEELNTLTTLADNEGATRSEMLRAMIHLMAKTHEPQD